MLIFDRFPNEKKARAFMAAITKEFKLKTYYSRQEEDGWLFDENEETETNVMPGGMTRLSGEPLRHNALDVFPHEMTAPIVCVERPHNSPPLDVSDTEKLAKQFLESDLDPNSDENIEVAIEERVEKFGGVFAGT